MTGETPGAAERPGGPEQRGDPASEAARRRRLDEVFGEVLPESTGDDRPDDRPEERPVGRAEERWYLENRPPHHDRT